MNKPKYFTVVNSTGSRFRFPLIGFKSSEGFPKRPYLGDNGAAYLANLETGQVDGIEGCRGITLQLVPHALDRLRKMIRLLK